MNIPNQKQNGMDEKIDTLKGIKIKISTPPNHFEGAVEEHHLKTGNYAEISTQIYPHLYCYT